MRILAQFARQIAAGAIQKAQDFTSVVLFQWFESSHSYALKNRTLASAIIECLVAGTGFEPAASGL